MSTYLFRLARFAYHRRRLVLGVWLVVLIGIIALATGLGGKENNNFTIPGTEAQNASNVLSAKLPALAGGSTQVVFAAPAGKTINTAAAKTAIDTSMANLKKVPQVSLVVDPYTGKLVSSDGRVGLGTVQYSAAIADVKTSTLDAVEVAVKPAQQAGLQVDYAGSVYPGSQLPLSELPELIGIIVAFLILMVTFGAFVAAGLPIISALIGVVTAIMGITAFASFINIASASSTVAIMLGLSCGIDYGLFILPRHRNNLLSGMDPEDSVPLAVGTAGSSVVFAGLTVIIALCGLSVVGIPFLTVMGLAAAGSVFIALMIALTLMPAVLGFAGHKIVSFVDFPGRKGHQAQIAHIAANEPEKTFGARWARFVVRFRLPILAGGVILLGVIALPVTKIQFGLPSGAAQSKQNTARKAYDLTSAHFGAGFNGALLVVADVSHAASKTASAELVAHLKAQPNVVAVTPAAAQNNTEIIQVIPKTGPNDTATATLVHRIRDDRTAIEGTTGITYLVGGSTASNIDVSSKLSSALPVFLLVVVGLAFILLTFAFRTILVPIKSILGFLLSVFAAFGAQVAVFQWGWGEKVFGIVPTQTVSFLPIIMLAIIFGLSSDYEVFVVSRIKEDFTKTGDARGAVSRGTGQSARVVTSAALIMFSIFVAFMFTNDPTIKAIGFSFATGVFLDAFVVRLTLVPAVMAIVGSRIWYHPQWFARWVPNADIEGERITHLVEDGTISAHTGYQREPAPVG